MTSSSAPELSPTQVDAIIQRLTKCFKSLSLWPHSFCDIDGLYLIIIVISYTSSCTAIRMAMSLCLCRVGKVAEVVGIRRTTVIVVTLPPTPPHNISNTLLSLNIDRHIMIIYWQDNSVQSHSKFHPAQQVSSWRVGWRRESHAHLNIVLWLIYK